MMPRLHDNFKENSEIPLLRMQFLTSGNIVASVCRPAGGSLVVLLVVLGKVQDVVQAYFLGQATKLV